ncbi:MAG: hypothetical protein ACD_21C00209G0006 [uncultured bacterium]|nr:MAG: hypothetical protein ACD_21C00209G0006 [uncultured bacterium]
MQYKNIKHYCSVALKNKCFKPHFNPALIGFVFLAAVGFSCSTSVFAADELAGAMSSVRDNFGANSVFIKLLYASEIVAGGYAWHKTKHPSAVIGIVVLALFMTFALAHWVFV